MATEVQVNLTVVWYGCFLTKVRKVAKVGHVTHHELSNSSGFGCLESSGLMRWRGRVFGSIQRDRANRPSPPYIVRIASNLTPPLWK